MGSSSDTRVYSGEEVFCVPVYKGANPMDSTYHQQEIKSEIVFMIV